MTGWPEVLGKVLWVICCSAHAMFLSYAVRQRSGAVFHLLWMLSLSGVSRGLPEHKWGLLFSNKHLSDDSCLHTAR